MVNRLNVIKKCRACGQAFYPFNHDSKYCSPGCTNRGRKGMKYKKSPFIKIPDRLTIKDNFLYNSF